MPKKFFRCVVLVGAAVAAGLACQSKSPGESVAVQFVQDYYVARDLQAAAGVSTALALEKVKQSLQLLQGTPPADATREQPKVSYSITQRRQEAPDAWSYIFELTIQPDKFPAFKRAAYIKLRDEGGTWKVSQFTEQDL